MNDSNKSKVALILGAGFSAEAGQPIMSNFGEFSLKQLYGIKPFDGIIKQKDKNAYYLLKKYGEIYEAFKNYCSKNSKFGKLNANNMEDLFTLAEMLNACGEKNLLLEIDNIETQKKENIEICIDDLFHAIYIWLWQIFRRVPLNNPSKWGITDNSKNAYYQFIQDLFEYGFGNVDIITTNYDILIEYLCNNNKYKVTYPIENYEIERTISNDDSPSIGNFIADPVEGLYSNILNICKLHGSVNFFTHKSNAKSNVKLITETGGKIGNSLVKDIFPSISAIDAIHELYENRNLIPSISQPSYAKIKENSWLETTWNYAANALYKADRWIFIGYSLPPSDGHIRTLLNVALMNKKNCPEIIVVSPSYDSIYNYKQMFNEEFEFKKRYFSEFILSHELKKYLN